eukprot:SAG25_NODE_265_length_10686_cov_15.394163_4_plen_615_part_00
MCEFCPAGKLVHDHKSGIPSTLRSMACGSCALGRFRTLLQQTSECTECPAGRYAGGGADICLRCSTGLRTNVPGAGASSCVPCSPGEEPNVNQTECLTCRGATYSQFGVKCIDCADVVDQQRTACLKCGAGTQPNANRTGCEPCEGASYSASGTCIKCEKSNIVDSDRKTCSKCNPGEEPNVNQTECLQCQGNKYSQFGVKCQECTAGTVDTKRTACLPCPARHQFTGHACECQDGFYNQTRGAVKCYESDIEEFESTDFALTPGEVCVPCDICLDCNSGREAKLQITDAFKLVHEVAGLSVAIFKCPLGDRSCIDDRCKLGYAGPLCNNCAAGYSRAGLQGECSECSSAEMSWVIVGGGAVVSLALTTGALFAVTRAETSNSSLLALAKIGIGMAQILCATQATFKIDFPAAFRSFLRILKIFALDMLGFLDVGCIAKYTYWQKLMFASLLAPCLLGSVMILYIYRKGQQDAQQVRSKMMFASLFLLYPFVSQTTFQAFACRDLGDASWLAVDYQISCDTDDYYVLTSIAIFSVMLYPIAIPVGTAGVLFYNREAIKRGPTDSAYGQFDFLVGDYNVRKSVPACVYWNNRLMYVTDVCRNYTTTGTVSKCCAK